MSRLHEVWEKSNSSQDSYLCNSDKQNEASDEKQKQIWLPYMYRIRSICVVLFVNGIVYVGYY